MEETVEAQHAGLENLDAPHGCYDGWQYVGHLVIDEAVRCRRCQINEHHARI